MIWQLKEQLLKKNIDMEQTFNLTGEQEKTILLNSVNAAFTTDEVKKELKETLNLQ